MELPDKAKLRCVTSVFIKKQHACNCLVPMPQQSENPFNLPTILTPSTSLVCHIWRTLFRPLVLFTCSTCSNMRVTCYRPFSPVYYFYCLLTFPASFYFSYAPCTTSCATYAVPAHAANISKLSSTDPKVWHLTFSAGNLQSASCTRTLLGLGLVLLA